MIDSNSFRAWTIFSDVVSGRWIAQPCGECSPRIRGRTLKPKAPIIFMILRRLPRGAGQPLGHFENLKILQVHYRSDTRPRPMLLTLTCTLE
ncbi:unnamed protein product, partial [Nesidiocoris tenuis]